MDWPERKRGSLWTRPLHACRIPRASFDGHERLGDMRRSNIRLEWQSRFIVYLGESLGWQNLNKCNCKGYRLCSWLLAGAAVQKKKQKKNSNKNGWRYQSARSGEKVCCPMQAGTACLTLAWNWQMLCGQQSHPGVVSQSAYFGLQILGPPNGGDGWEKM